MGVGESPVHKEMKAAAVEYLKGLGYTDVRTEYVLNLNDVPTCQGGNNHLRFDAAGFAEGKKPILIEVGTLSNFGPGREKVANDHGFLYEHWPYSKVQRLNLKLIMALQKIDPSISKAVEILLSEHERIKKTGDVVEEMRQVVREELEKVRG